MGVVGLYNLTGIRAKLTTFGSRVEIETELDVIGSKGRIRSITNPKHHQPLS